MHARGVAQNKSFIGVSGGPNLLPDFKDTRGGVKQLQPQA